MTAPANLTPPTGPTPPPEPAPPAPAAAGAAPAKKEPLTTEVGGKRVLAILVEKNADGSGGKLVPLLKAKTDCTRCGGVGYIRHGELIPCECTPEGKSEKYNAVYSR